MIFCIKGILRRDFSFEIVETNFFVGPSSINIILTTVTAGSETRDF